MSWLVTQDVLDRLGLDQSGAVLDACVAATESLIPTWRIPSPPTDWSTVKATHRHVYEAAVEYAALRYQANVTPEGFAGFDATGSLLDPPHAKVVQIRHMARANAPAVG